MNQITTLSKMSTKEVSGLTGKQHKNVIRDVQNMKTVVEEDGSKLSHEQYQEVRDDRGYVSEILLDKELTITLVTGYSIPLRRKVIARWQELEDVNSLSPAEQLLYHAKRLVDQERRLNDLAMQQAETQVQVRALINGEDHFTVVGYGNLTGYRFSLETSQRVGRAAKSICVENGWDVGKTTHPHYGVINSYPREALDLAVQQVLQ